MQKELSRSSFDVLRQSQARNLLVRVTREAGNTTETLSAVPLSNRLLCCGSLHFSSLRFIRKQKAEIVRRKFRAFSLQCF